MDRERMIEVLKRDRDLAMFNPMTGECVPMNEDNAESAEALSMAIAALEAYVPDTNVGDMISRQAAIDAVNTALFPKINTAKDAEKALRGLPPVQPKHGHWDCTDDIYENAECSCCKWDSGEAWSYAWANFNFCPNCGADMRGEAE